MKRPDLLHPTTVGRVVAELTIIVAGVLIALAAQSWWEERQLDEERSRVRRAVAADLTAVLDEIRGEWNRTDSILGDIRWMLDRSEGFDATPDSVFNRRATYALWEIAGVDLSLPAYDDLKGSGRLELLSDDARAAMTRLDLRLRTVEGIDEDVFQYQIRNLDPWLLDHAPLRSMLSWDADRGPGGAPRSADGSSRLSAELLGSLRVENMLLAKLELTDNLRGAVVRLDAAAREALGAVGDPGR
jgi:hypothetical protein